VTDADMSRKPDPLDHLADALAEDILAAPAERVMAEAAEDAGDEHAVAASFDRVAARAARQSRRQRFAERIRALAAVLDPRASWRPAMAAVAGIVVVVVAGDLYLHVRPEERKLASAPAPGALSKSELSTNLAPAAEPKAESKPASVPQVPRDAIAAQAPKAFGGNRINDRVADTDQSAGAPAAAPAPPAAEAALPRTLVPGGAGALTAARTPAQTAATPRRPVSDERLRALLSGEPQSARADTEKAKRESAQPSAGSASARSQLPSDAPSFGWPLRGEARAVHDGIDVAVPPGTDIRAAADGVVVYADSDTKGFGNMVVLRHRGGFATVYGHASAILVKPDQQVSGGEVIAKSGRSGDADGPKLHFEIRKDAAPVDPVQFLPPGEAR
jgi:murein DD-endopeptidase MepM/ murein hydrolase activator NlpD